MKSPRSRSSHPSPGAFTGAAGDAPIPVAPLSNLARLAPMTEAILFLQNVTGYVPIDLVRDNQGIAEFIAHGPGRVHIRMRYNGRK